MFHISIYFRFKETLKFPRPCGYAVPDICSWYNGEFVWFTDTLHFMIEWLPSFIFVGRDESVNQTLYRYMKTDTGCRISEVPEDYCNTHNHEPSKYEYYDSADEKSRCPVTNMLLNRTETHISISFVEKADEQVDARNQFTTVMTLIWARSSKNIAIINVSPKRERADYFANNL